MAAIREVWFGWLVFSSIGIRVAIDRWRVGEGS